MLDDAETRARIKRLIVEGLRLEGVAPDSIGDEAPLFGPGGLGLDSVDALELVVLLEKSFGLRLQSHEVKRESFANVASLAAMVRERLG